MPVARSQRLPAATAKAEAIWGARNSRRTLPPCRRVRRPSQPHESRARGCHLCDRRHQQGVHYRPHQSGTRRVLRETWTTDGAASSHGGACMGRASHRSSATALRCAGWEATQRRSCQPPITLLSDTSRGCHQATLPAKSDTEPLEPRACTTAALRVPTACACRTARRSFPHARRLAARRRHRARPARLGRRRRSRQRLRTPALQGGLCVNRGCRASRRRRPGVLLLSETRRSSARRHAAARRAGARARWLAATVRRHVATGRYTRLCPPRPRRGAEPPLDPRAARRAANDSASPSTSPLDGVVARRRGDRRHARRQVVHAGRAGRWRPHRCAARCSRSTSSSSRRS